MHKLHVPRTVSTSGREQLLANLKPPMVEAPSDAIEVDLDRLFVTFTIGEEHEGAPTLWAEMRVVPQTRDAIRLRAIGIERDGFGVVRARVWMDANWMVIHVDEIDATDGDDSGGKSSDSAAAVVLPSEIDGDELTPEQMAERHAETSRIADAATPA